MSLWLCEEHGLVGPEACCPQASRASLSELSASVPPEPPTLSDEPYESRLREIAKIAAETCHCRDGHPAISRSAVLWLVGEVRALRAKVARLTEWKEAILGALEARQEFREGEWAGDKRGWGYVFEFINWLFRDRDALRAELAEAKRVADQAANNFDMMVEKWGDSERQLNALRTKVAALETIVRNCGLDEALAAIDRSASSESSGLIDKSGSL